MEIDKNELETRLEQIQIEKTGFEETYQSVMILMDSLRSVLKKTYLFSAAVCMFCCKPKKYLQNMLFYLCLKQLSVKIF